MEKLKLKKPATLTIKRSKWLRGDAKDDAVTNVLLDDNGRMCCLGFQCVATGVPAYLLENIAKPPQVLVTCPIPALTKRTSAGVKETLFTLDAIDINDDENIEDEERERLLRELWKKHDMKLRFVK